MFKVRRQWQWQQPYLIWWVKGCVCPSLVPLEPAEFDLKGGRFTHHVTKPQEHAVTVTFGFYKRHGRTSLADLLGWLGENATAAWSFEIDDQRLWSTSDGTVRFADVATATAFALTFG